MEFKGINMLPPNVRKVFADFVCKSLSPYIIDVELKSVWGFPIDKILIHAVVYSEILAGEGGVFEKVILLSTHGVYKVDFPWPWYGFISSIIPSRRYDGWIALRTDQREEFRVDLRKVFSKAVAR
jgi:hypothetical protein